MYTPASSRKSLPCSASDRSRNPAFNSRIEKHDFSTKFALICCERCDALRLEHMESPLEGLFSYPNIPKKWKEAYRNF